MQKIDATTGEDRDGSLRQPLSLFTIGGRNAGARVLQDDLCIPFPCYARRSIHPCPAILAPGQPVSSQWSISKLIEIASRARLEPSSSYV